MDGHCQLYILSTIGIGHNSGLKCDGILFVGGSGRFRWSIILNFDFLQNRVIVSRHIRIFSIDEPEPASGFGEKHAVAVCVEP